MVNEQKWKDLKKDIAYCGNDCSCCPRYIATQNNSISELEHIAIIWQKIGWRNKLLSSDEIKCYGCKTVQRCRYKIKECCEAKGLENCGQCDEYLCAKVVNAFNKGLFYEEKSKEILSPEIFRKLSKAFFKKPANLADARNVGNGHNMTPAEDLKINFKKLNSNKDAPMDLLLLADPSEEFVLSYLEKGLCYVAQLEDETIGVVLILENQSSNHNEKTIEVMNIAIKGEFQNRGIGKRFLEYVIGEIRKGDTTTIEIGTGNSGVHQMLLYQKCGFRIVGVDFDFFRRNYPERLYQNGIECRDMIRMKIDLTELDERSINR